MIIRYLLLIPLLSTLFACSPLDNNETTNSVDDGTSDITEKEQDEMIMKLYIDEQIMDVSWEDNASIEALKKLAKDTLAINMHQYGGFEQTGMIGSSIIRNDSQINTNPGDIVLYNGNQISVFYEPSSWSYTMLGHINMNKNELNTLLNKDKVTLVLKGE